MAALVFAVAAFVVAMKIPSNHLIRTLELTVALPAQEFENLFTRKRIIYTIEDGLKCGVKSLLTGFGVIRDITSDRNLFHSLQSELHSNYKVSIKVTSFPLHGNMEGKGQDIRR